MPYIECPFCNEFADFEGEDFPDHASDTTFANCPKCEKEVELSWYAVFEASRPTPCATDGGESALEDSPFETGIRRGAVVISPAAANT